MLSSGIQSISKNVSIDKPPVTPHRYSQPKQTTFHINCYNNSQVPKKNQALLINDINYNLSHKDYNIIAISKIVQPHNILYFVCCVPNI